MTDTSKPPLILWGGSRYAATAFDLARRAGFPVAAQVADRETGLPLPRVSRDGAGDLAQTHADAMIVGCDLDPFPGVGDGFITTINAVRDKYRLGHRILHPSFLADHLPLTRTRYALTGFPGSGCMSLFTVAGSILGEMGPAANEHPALADMALRAWWTHTGWLAGKFDHLGVSEIQPSAPRAAFSRVRFYMPVTPERPRDLRLVLFGAPHRAWFWNATHTTTHEPATEAVVDFHAARGHRLIATVRHPLDCVVSVAGKLLRAHPEALIASPGWFDAALSAVIRYYEEAPDLAAAGRLDLFRYEDFLRDPAPTIRRLGAVMGHDLDDAACRRHLAKLRGADGFRSLIAGTGHLWAPGEGKWRHYLGRLGLLGPVLARRDLIELCDRLGYSLDPDQTNPAFDRLTIDRPHLSTPLERRVQAMAGADYLGLIGQEVTLTHDEFFAEPFLDGRLLVVGERPLAALARAVLESPLSRTLMDAMTLDEPRLDRHLAPADVMARSLARLNGAETTPPVLRR